MSRPRAIRETTEIEIVGARANNLKDLDVAFPLRAATMVVGVSGSGKSSLLADTLASEVNTRMRRFLGVAQDHLEAGEPQAFVGPTPVAIHFSQGAFRASRRTTVGTCSGFLATLRELFVRHATPWADEVGEPVPSASAKSYAAWLERHYAGRLKVWAVPMRNVRGDGRRAVATLQRAGVRHLVVRSETDPPALRESGRRLPVDGFRPLAPEIRHAIEAEIAELELPRQERELLPALGRAFACGTVVIELLDPTTMLAALETTFGYLLDSDRHHVHPEVLLPFAPPSPGLLSFNQPSSADSGACPQCSGLGESMGVALDRLVAHPERSMHAGAFALWTAKGYKYLAIQHETIEGLRGIEGFDPDVAWQKLPEPARRLVLSGGIAVSDRDRRTGRRLGSPRLFEGFVPAIVTRFKKGTPTSARLAPFVQEGPCPSCGGSRWSRSARALRVGGRNVADLLALTFVELHAVARSRGELERNVARNARSQIARLAHLAQSFVTVGLGHLSGNRGMLTVSEGESRRLRLAGLLHARGRDLALLLDEPARGLHEADIAVLNQALVELKDRHTVILNDHRLALARAVDHVIEIGPGAGQQGGRLIRQGPPEKILSRPEPPPFGSPRTVPAHHPALEIKGARLHNLHDVSCRIPLGRLVAITGVSGSGKSSFVRGILLPALATAPGIRMTLESFPTLSGGIWRGFSGAAAVHEVVAVEQRRPEPNRRSQIATFLGIADILRRAYGAAPAARKLGLEAPDFGLNGGKGRCATCLGLGEVPDGPGLAPCPVCAGRCFDNRALAVRLEGRNIAELLNQPISELASAPPAWAGDLMRLFELVAHLDLGYLTLGRRVDRLSGGEVQRLRIADRLWRARVRGLFLVLDEPSAGLHPSDVAKLLQALGRIVETGENTVLLVEHNLDLIRACDWLVDFGPGGGPEGGRVLAQGPPATMEALDTPTGRALGGRTEKARSHLEKTRPTDLQTQPPTADQAHHARRWLKLLLGQEASLPPDVSGEQNLEDLAVVLEDLEVGQPRPHEAGGLDRDLAHLFLLIANRSEHGSRQALLEAWQNRPEAILCIAPGLPLLQIWGLRVPRSQRQIVVERLRAFGLETCAADAEEIQRWRASGRRFEPADRTPEARCAAVEDALAVGGGYVELRTPKGRILSRLRERHLDLDRGWVAPIRLTPAHLCRAHVVGRCPACRGDGRVVQLDLGLLIGDRRLAPTAEGFLRPEAAAILKGARRLVQLPFYRRLADEGCWNLQAPFNRLEPADREVFLFGHWQRPDPGSFLKNRQADPEKVSSWLRWDGFFHHLLAELERSRSPSWAEGVRASSHRVPCGLCEGTGMALASRLVGVGGRSFHAWVTEGTVTELCQALRGLTPTTSVERHLRDRIVRGLAPVAKRLPKALLGAPLEDLGLLRESLKCVVGDQLHLPIVG